MREVFILAQTDLVDESRDRRQPPPSVPLTCRIRWMLGASIVKSAHWRAGRQHDLTSAASLTPTVDMPDTLVLPGSIAGSAHACRRPSPASRPTARRRPPGVRVAGELDIATAPQLEPTLRDPRLQARLVVLDRG
jgi:hypothetical protein